MNDPRENCPWKCKHCLCYEGEIKRLSAELTKANARERKAFMAGFWVDSNCRPINPDDEQEWQQYRCQDDSDWKVASEEDAAKIDAAVLGKHE